MKKIILLFAVLIVISLCKIVFAYLENEFVDNCNNTITDKKTGLVWQKCSNGHNTNLCEGLIEDVNWKNALKYCSDLELSGYSDWRLPNIKEFLTIIDESKSNPAIDSSFFPNTSAGEYWSSTTNINSVENAMCIAFDDGGYIINIEKVWFAHVRCVRNL